MKPITIYNVDENTSAELIGKLKSRASSINEGVDSYVRPIMEDVRNRGYDAVREYSLKPAPFDNAEPYELTSDDIERGAAECPKELYAVIEEAAANITDYQSRLKPKSSFWQTPIGTLGQIIQPLKRVGIYVPGGTAAYPSSLLMTVIPAKVAGVGEITLCTPPTTNLNAGLLAAAKITGVDRLFAVGGVQAIGAMAYGADPIPKVDKIVGPGNVYVTAAKRYAFGDIDIDMLAGPSDILIIADADANPGYIAADMLSQAEHDELASAVLITTSDDLADKVVFELDKQLLTLPRSNIASKSLMDNGAIYVCSEINIALTLADAIAPEHLELAISDEQLLDEIIKMNITAGAIFIGQNTPESLGDYFAGPSHVLPTSGTAASFSGLSCGAFVRTVSYIKASETGIQQAAKKIGVFARAEGLEAHGRAAEIRLTGDDNN